MAPKPKSYSGGNQKISTGIGLIIFLMPIIAIIGLAWLLLLKLEYLPENLTLNQDFQTWLNIWSVIFLVIIFSLLLSIPHGKLSKEPEPKKHTKPKPKKDASKVKVQEYSSEAPTKEDKPLEFVPLAKTGETQTEPKLPLKTRASTATDISDEQKLSTEPEKELQPAAVVAKPVSKDKMKPLVFEYPQEVEGGLYGDTFIELDSESVLKLRTLVVKDIYLM